MVWHCGHLFCPPGSHHFSVKQGRPVVIHLTYNHVVRINELKFVKYLQLLKVINRGILIDIFPPLFRLQRPFSSPLRFWHKLSTVENLIRFTSSLLPDISLPLPHCCDFKEEISTLTFHVSICWGLCLFLLFCIFYATIYKNALLDLCY